MISVNKWDHDEHLSETSGIVNASVSQIKTTFLINKVHVAFLHLGFISILLKGVNLLEVISPSNFQFTSQFRKR